MFVYTPKNQCILSTRTPNDDLDFHFAEYASRIHVLKKLFMVWKHKAGLVCVHCVYN